jgi:hypothetical protein
MAAAAVYSADTSQSESNETKDTIFLLGGVALMIFGAAFVVTSPTVRRYLGNVNVGGLLHAAIPDLERYLKLRAM